MLAFIVNVLVVTLAKFIFDLSNWIVVVGILNFPVFVLVGYGFYGSWDNYWSAVKFWIIPDVISLFRGEYVDDIWAELGLFFFVAICVGIIIFEYKFLGGFLITQT